MGFKFHLPSQKRSKEPKSFFLSPAWMVARALGLKEYLEVRQNSPGDLYVQPGGEPVKRDFLAKKIKSLIAAVGLDPSQYNTHSLRVGRATDLALQGVPEALIRETGRGSSNAYLQYVRFECFRLPK